MTEPHGVLQNTAPGDFGDYPADHNAELDMDNFIWEDVLEEIGRFENFDVDMTFSLSEWSIFNQHLRAYITAKRILSKVSNESNPGLTLHKVNLDAPPIGDVNVTRRSNSSSRMEQKTSGIRQRRDWLFNAKNSLKLDADRESVSPKQRE